MKKLIAILLMAILIVITGVAIYRNAYKEGYAIGYEQCAYDTSAYLEIHPGQGYVGMPFGLRNCIIQCKWKVGTPENMKAAEKAAEKLCELERVK